MCHTGSAGPMPGATAGISVLWGMTLLCTLFYFFPVLGGARAQMCYRVALFSTCLSYAIALWKQFPEHKFATLSEPRFRAAPESQFFMTGLILAIAPPIPFVLVPLAVHAGHSLCTTQKACPY